MTTSYGEIPSRFAGAEYPLPPPNRFATQTRTCRFIALDDQYVLMNTSQHVDHSKGDSRPARRTRSVKAKPVARLERSPKTSLGSFRAGEHCNSATDPEDIRRGRRDPGTCFDKILPDSERRDQELVLLGTPLPGRLLREAVGFIGQSTLELTRHTY
jgi:hypothetical protein